MNESEQPEVQLVTLKEAPAARAFLPSHATLKRMSAAGELDAAVAGHTTGRYPATLYDLDRLLDVCSNRGQAAKAAQTQRFRPGASPDASLPKKVQMPGAPAKPAANQDSPPEHAREVADTGRILEAVVALAGEVQQLRDEVAGLNVARRSLQLKYDGENQTLRQQVQDQAQEIKALRAAGSGLDAALVLKRLTLIGSRLGL